MLAAGRRCETKSGLVVRGLPGVAVRVLRGLAVEAHKGGACIMTKTKAEAKVRKLRRLAERAGSAEEAATAARKAWELSKEFGVGDLGDAPTPVPQAATPRPKVVVMTPVSAPVSTPSDPVAEALADALLAAGRTLEQEIRRAVDGMLGVPARQARRIGGRR
jgi:hypothetical protein